MDNFYLGILQAGSQGCRASLKLGKLIENRDLIGLKKFFRGLRIGAKVANVVMIVIGVLCLIMLGQISLQSYLTAQYIPPSKPVSVGAAPIVQLVDETGYIDDREYQELIESLTKMSEVYKIQFAVYNTSEAAHDVYSEFFKDENGCLIYIEEHKEYARVQLYLGNNLRYLDTDKYMSKIIFEDLTLNRHSVDRAHEVVRAVSSGFTSIFKTPGTDIYIDATMELLMAIGFFLFCVFIGKVMESILYALILGRWMSKKKLKEFERQVIAYVEGQE